MGPRYRWRGAASGEPRPGRAEPCEKRCHQGRYPKRAAYTPPAQRGRRPGAGCLFGHPASEAPRPLETAPFGDRPPPPRPRGLSVSEGQKFHPNHPRPARGGRSLLPREWLAEKCPPEAEWSLIETAERDPALCGGGLGKKGCGCREIYPFDCIALRAAAAAKLLMAEKGGGGGYYGDIKVVGFKRAICIHALVSSLACTCMHTHPARRPASLSGDRSPMLVHCELVYFSKSYLVLHQVSRNSAGVVMTTSNFRKPAMLGRTWLLVTHHSESDQSCFA